MGTVIMALIPVSVGQAREGYGTKYQFGLRQTCGDGQGWAHQFAFQAHEAAVPNTVPMCLGFTSSGYRYIAKWGEDAGGNGWSHLGTVHVFPQKQPGTKPFTVSHAEPMWRWRINQGKEAEGQEWKHDFVFWAYPLDGQSGGGYGGGNHGGHGGGNHGGHGGGNHGGHGGGHHGGHHEGGNHSHHDGGHHHGDNHQGGGYFHIVSHLNGLYLGLDRSNNLCMNVKSRDDCLKWKWEGKILKSKTGLVLDIDVNNQRPGAKVCGYNEHGGANQHWRMDKEHIISDHSGLVLDILNNDRNPGAAVKAWTRGHHSQNQLWKIEH